MRITATSIYGEEITGYIWQIESSNFHDIAYLNGKAVWESSVRWMKAEDEEVYIKQYQQKAGKWKTGTPDYVGSYYVTIQNATDSIEVAYFDGRHWIINGEQDSWYKTQWKILAWWAESEPTETYGAPKSSL